MLINTQAKTRHPIQQPRPIFTIPITIDDHPLLPTARSHTQQTTLHLDPQGPSHVAEVNREKLKVKT